MLVTWVITTQITSLKLLITLSVPEVTQWLIMIPLTTVFPTHPSNLMVVAEATEAEVERKRDSLTLPLSWPETK